MNTVFTPPGPPDRPVRKAYEQRVEPLPAQVIASGSAANADHVSERPVAPAAVRVEAPAGWDAYEVWRRCIKDARDRRHTQE